MLAIGWGNMRNLVVHGQGVPGVDKVSNPHLDNWDIDIPPDASMFNVAFHCGSGRQFPSLVQYCQRWRVPLIQASSSLKENGDKNGKDIPLPTSPDFPLILAPNLSLLTIALQRVLPELGRMVQLLEAKSGVVEAHQASKKSTPITAHNIAVCFGLQPGDVESIRKEWIHRLLGVPEEFLGGFARHFILTEACGSRLRLIQEVDGRDTYRLGLGVLIRELVKLGDQLTDGIHEAGDIIFGPRVC